MRVTARSEKPLAELAPGIRRTVYVDAPDGAGQLSLGAAELAPGKELPVHRHKVGERYVEEGFYVLEGNGEVQVGDEVRPIGPGSFCVMSPAEGFHTIRNTGTAVMRFVMSYAGTGVQMERRQ